MMSGCFNERLRFGFLSLTVLLSLNLWSFQLIPEVFYNVSKALVLLWLLLLVFQHHLVLRSKIIFNNNVFFFMLVPAISTFGAYIFHDQSFTLSLLILRLNLLWLLYYVLHLFNFSKEKIIKLIIFVGVVWAAITIIQQFTYPIYYFFSKGETDRYSIYRGGVYRFMIDGQQYGAFCLFYFFYQYLIKRKSKYLLFVLLCLVGFYCYGTRQFAVAAMASMLIAVFMVKGRSQLSAIVVLLVAVPIAIMYKDQLFGYYIQMTSEQLESGDNVRESAAKFWMNDYWPHHWAARVTGNGPSHMLSRYGQEIELIRIYHRFYRSDVGIFGVYNEFGILYAANIIWVSFKGLRNKYYTYNNKYLKLIFIYSIVLLLTSQYFSSGAGIPFYCLVFYLVDKSFEEKLTDKYGFKTINRIG